MLLCVVVSLALGARSVWVAAVVQALLGDGSSRDAMVVTEMRLPRTFVGVAVVSCDLIAQRALPIEGFPVGVITATVGAPCLLILMLRESGPAHRGTA